VSYGWQAAQRRHTRLLDEHVTITLPDGSSRACRPPARPCATLRQRFSPDLAKAAFAAIVDGKLVDLSYPSQRDASCESLPTRIPKRSRSCATARRI
jgi:threonyl-tRNA synthetase